MTTSGQEMEYIWRSSWSFMKLVYVVTRYYSLFFLLVKSFVSTNMSLSVNFCTHYLLFEIWGSNALVMVVDILIIARIYAIYNRNIWTGFSLMALWLAEFIGTFMLVGFGLKGTGAMVNPLPGLLPGCQLANPANYHLLIIAWGVVSGFEAVYVAITMIKLLRIIRSSGFSVTPLLNVFFRDGAAYFLIILAVYLLNTFLEKFGAVELQGTGDSWLIATVSITACRLVLNIRNTAAPSQVLSRTGATGFETEILPGLSGLNVGSVRSI